jgi:hypothetical protein
MNNTQNPVYLPSISSRFFRTLGPTEKTGAFSALKFFNKGEGQPFDFFSFVLILRTLQKKTVEKNQRS